MEVILSIGGMRDNQCVEKIGHEVNALAGIKAFSASFKKKSAFICFLDDKLDKAEIVRVIENLGYKVIRVP